MSDFVITRDCDSTDDTICHRSHKYTDKYKGKSGKWIYVYTKPGGEKTSTDITTGEETSTTIPKTKVYERNGSSLLTKSSTYRISNDTAYEYNEIGKLDQASRKAEKWIGKTVNKVAKLTPKTVINGAIAVDKYIKKFKKNFSHVTHTKHESIDR